MDDFDKMYPIPRISHLTGDMTESRQSEVCLHDIQAHAVEQLVQFAYTAEINIGGKECSGIKQAIKLYRVVLQMYR